MDGRKIIKGCRIFGRILIIIGILFLPLGCVGNDLYENNSIDCIAVITDIHTKTNIEDIGTSLDHTYYGTYTADGNVYTNRYVGSEHRVDTPPKYAVGDSLAIKVNGDDPSSLAEKGTGMFVAGTVFIVGGCFFSLLPVYIKWHNKKREKEQAR